MLDRYLLVVMVFPVCGMVRVDFIVYLVSTNSRALNVSFSDLNR